MVSCAHLAMKELFGYICSVCTVGKPPAEQNRRIIEEKANALKIENPAEYLQEIVRQKQKGLSFNPICLTLLQDVKNRFSIGIFNPKSKFNERIAVCFLLSRQAALVAQQSKN